MQMKTFIIAALLATLFTVSLVTFGIELTSRHDVNNPLMNDTSFNESFGDLEEELRGNQAIAEAQLNVSAETTPVTEGGESSLESIPRTAHTFWAAATNIYSLTFGLLGRALGIPPIALTAITAILVITIVLLIWKLWKTGQ